MEVQFKQREFFPTIFKVLRRPSQFFKDRKHHENWGDAIGFYFFLLFLSLILSFTWSFSLGFLIASDKFPKFEDIIWGAIWGKLFINLFVSFILTFLWALLTHIWTKIFRGKGKYKDSYQVYIYSRVPLLLTTFIPYVNILGWIYSFYLLAKGTHILHSLPQRRAYFMYFILFAGFLALLFVTGNITLEKVK